MNVNDIQAKLAKLKAGDHLCLIYDTGEEHRAVLISYIRQGLERNEKVFYVADAGNVSDITGYLKDSGLDVEPYLKHKQLIILFPSELYLLNGRFDPDLIIRMLGDETDKAIAEGYSALRVTGETNWVLQKPPGWERLMEYEIKLNTFFPGSKTIALCQYDRRKFDARVLLDILTTHPISIVGTDIFDNIYYVPPEELHSEQASAYRLNRWTDTLKKLEKEKNELLDKQAEILKQKKVLQENEQHFRTLADSGTALIYTSDSDMKADYFNRTWLKFTGRTAEQEMGDGWLESIHPDDLAKSMGSRKNAFDRRKQFVTVFRLRRKDGVYRWMQGNGSPRYDTEGRFIGYIGHCLDITEVKEAEERLVFVNRLLETLQKINHFIFKAQNLDVETLLEKTCNTLFETGDYPVVLAGQIKKKPCKILFTAKAGIAVETVKDIPVHTKKSGYAENPALAAVIKKAPVVCRDIKQNSPWLSYLGKAVKSKKRFHSCIGLPISMHEEISRVLLICSNRQDAFDSQEKTLLVELSEDITLAWEMILMEGEKKELLEQIVRSEKLAAVGELIAGVAHEINNPLTGIMGLAEIMLLEDKVKLDKSTRKDIENMHKSSERVYKIVANLLRFARREEPMRKNISVSEVVDRVLEMRAYELSTRNIGYKKKYQPCIPNIMADPSQLEQVFLNLINNAEYVIRETGKGGIITVNVFLEGKKKDGQKVVVEILDTGPGISEDVLKKLFDPFFTTKPAGKGTGLGLSVSYGIIKEHGGEIIAANKKEGGAVFTIKLPVKKEAGDGK
jgi:PAS domain S-box-containing protein